MRRVNRRTNTAVLLAFCLCAARFLPIVAERVCFAVRVAVAADCAGMRRSPLLLTCGHCHRICIFMRMLRMRAHFKGIPFFSRVQSCRTIGRRGTDCHFRIYATYNGLRIAGDMYT